MDWIKIRAWDDVAKRMSYGKMEQFDDMLGFRFDHFDTENPVYMRWTGLHDKNGKEIYEGDILSNGQHIDWIVIFEEASFKVKFPNPINTDRYVLTRDMANGREIIGNVWEDGELLNDRQKTETD